MAERARIARRCRRTRCEVPQSRAAIPLKHFYAIVVGDFPGAGGAMSPTASAGISRRLAAPAPASEAGGGSVKAFTLYGL